MPEFLRRIPAPALVAGGYAAAFLAAIAAVAVKAMLVDPADAQASGGMHAFGEAYLFVGVFGLLALVPTGGALHLLKPYRRFWIALSAACLGLALTGAAAAAVFAAGRHAGASPALAAWSALAVLRILLAPVLAPGFVVVAIFAPVRRARLALAAATVVELGVIAFAAVTWVIPVALGRE